MIPEQLKQKGIKFVLLERGGKKPFQKEWQNKIIAFDSPELVFHLDNNHGNYGVMGGGEKRVIIIDFDNEKVQNEICRKLPDTFTVKTGSGKLHKYFTSDKCESFKIFDGEMNTLADIQGEGKQVVAPNSIHPNGNKYEVVDSREIVFLPYSEIRALLMPYDRKTNGNKKEIERPKGILTDDFLERLKSEISVENVLGSFGINTSRTPTACPFHTSNGGKCLGFNYETAHCFHCEGSWNIFSLVKEMKKCDFKEALVYLANLSGLQEELELSKRRYIESQKESEYSIRKEIRNKYFEFICEKPKKWSEATELLVEYIRGQCEIYTTKDDIKSEIWIYKEGIYVPQGKSEIKIILRELLEKHYSEFILNQVVSKIEADTFIDAEKFFQNKYIDEIPVQNGILNLNSRELKPFSSEKIFFNKLKVDYRPTASCPQVEKFLNDVLSNESDKDVFYELGGFCLMDEYKYEKACMFVGDGRNGKDKTLELIKRVLGVENCSSITLTSLTSDNFSVSELFGKKSNLAGDIGNQDLKDISMFKALTGRSLISAKRKFLKDIVFVNHAKFIFACNELPMVYDLSKGFWDRWVLLEFPYTFVTKDEYNRSEIKENLKIRDENIIDRITSPDELAGLLNKFLEGYDRLAVNRNFSTTRGSEEIKNLWIRKSNSFIAFCMDKIVEDYDKRIEKRELRKEYSKYCKNHKIRGKHDLVIKRVLQETYGAEDGQGAEFGLRYWEGITWKK